MGCLGAILEASWRPLEPFSAVGNPNRREPQNLSNTKGKSMVLGPSATPGRPLGVLSGRIGCVLISLEVVLGASRAVLGHLRPSRYHVGCLESRPGSHEAPKRASRQIKRPPRRPNMSPRGPPGEPKEAKTIVFLAEFERSRGSGMLGLPTAQDSPIGLSGPSRCSLRALQGRLGALLGAPLAIFGSS